MNALMGIKELKFLKTDVIIYDMRDYESFTVAHFWNSQYYDIGLWDDGLNDEFIRVTTFKQLFLVGDDNLFTGKDFDGFIKSISKVTLKASGVYFYNFDLKTIENENLEKLIVYNEEKTKLLYYPSLVIENEQLWWGGIFLWNEKIEKEQLQKLWIYDALYIGDKDILNSIKK